MKIIALKRRCWICGSYGHHPSRCPAKNVLREQIASMKHRVREAEKVLSPVSSMSPAVVSAELAVAQLRSAWGLAR
jgi:hypothetical protein